MYRLVLHACSSVLPVPFAFSRMGVLLGIITMAVVAYSNSLTSVLLLRAAGLTGHDSYEGVAYAIGGKYWKVLHAAHIMPAPPLHARNARFCHRLAVLDRVFVCTQVNFLMYQRPALPASAYRTAT